MRSGSGASASSRSWPKPAIARRSHGVPPNAEKRRRAPAPPVGCRRAGDPCPAQASSACFEGKLLAWKRDRGFRPEEAPKKNPQPWLGVLDEDPGDDLLSHARCTLPSARARFTSEFGMGSGGSTQLLSPERGWRVADAKDSHKSPRARSRWLPRNKPMQQARLRRIRLGRSELVCFEHRRAVESKAA